MKAFLWNWWGALWCLLLPLVFLANHFGGNSGVGLFVWAWVIGGGYIYLKALRKKNGH